ncbi:MAG: C4-dicarboxylic acid transporter DauA [Myxococcales bacterium]|nr:C4-dicarboxylic acid transporter DauA [Myxococcales bacterium]
MIRRRVAQAASLFPLGKSLRLGTALRERLRRGYTKADLRADVLAGLVVGIVALPLSMALAVASGAPPQHGLYTAIVAGAVIALLGGSPVQVSGPTAAFVVLLTPIASRYGLGGLMMATVLAGSLLVVMGIARFGRLMQFVPYPVVSGFTAGIAVVIALLQLKDFLGLTVAKMPEHTPERVVALGRALPSARWQDVLIGALTLAVLVLWPKLTQKIPSPLVALTFGGLLAFGLGHALPGFHVDTIADRFSYVVGGVTHAGIPRSAPLPLLPWEMAGPDGKALGLSLALLRELSGPAFAIAMLGAIESLLSAVVADGMTGTRHDPDVELVAQGIGNIVVPFFGGFAATGAIARTATNIRYGARSPIAGLVHSLFVLAAVVALAPLLGHLPMASLAALLLVIAWNMSELRHVVHMARIAPKSDVAVLASCFVLTVAFDMVVSVTVGVMLAAVLFMRRMAEVSNAQLVGAGGQYAGLEMPAGVTLYRIEGPLFFGAAQKAMHTFSEIGKETKVVVFDVSQVPAMDATGIVNLESALERLKGRNTLAILVGAQAQPRTLIERAELTGTTGVVLCERLADALEKADDYMETRVPSVAAPPVSERHPAS